MMSMQATPPTKTVSISIVSHGQFHIVSQLLADLESFCFFIHEIILTVNIPEVIDVSHFKNEIAVIRNDYPRGFGENHNRAFLASSGDYFLVLNPDLRIGNFDFTSFLDKLSPKGVGVSTPMVVNGNGKREDHIRPFPSFAGLLRRVSYRCFSDGSRADLSPKLSSPFWIGGMFMGFKSSVFRDIGGFDQRYFMYLEDVDICAELLSASYEIVVDSSNQVVHDARRGSRRNLRLFLIHCASYLRYFRKWAGKSIG
jgi:N-acetylglucosaminyl-diphospho-decaprenol L-rhamnosyltransferase